MNKNTLGYIPSDKHVVGWREYVSLPDLGIPLLHAKVDTGARTSALHAVDVETELRGVEEWVSFGVPLPGERQHVRHSARLVDRRKIKNTSGIAETRYIISTVLKLGDRRWRIEMSLADREQMKFDLIIGRTALRRHKLLVAPGKSFLAGLPKKTIKKSNY